MTYCARNRPGADLNGRGFDVCREHHSRRRPRGRRYRAPDARALPGILDDDAMPRPRPRRWPFLRLAATRRLRPRGAAPLRPIRKPTTPTAAPPSKGTPSPGSVVARAESLRSARTAVAALASLAVHRPASQRKDSRP